MMLTASGLPKLTTLHKHAVVAVRFATSWRDWMTILSQGPANSLDDVEKVERIRWFSSYKDLGRGCRLRRGRPSMEVPETGDPRRRRARTPPEDPPLATARARDRVISPKLAEVAKTVRKACSPKTFPGIAEKKKKKAKNESLELPLANSVDRIPSPTVTDTLPLANVGRIASPKNTDSSNGASPLNLPLASAIRKATDPPDAQNTSKSTETKTEKNELDKAVTGSSERNVEPGASPNVSITTEKPKGQEHVAIDIPNASTDEFALSLSGCGFLGSYHFGVMICFRNNAKKFMSRVTRIAGASGGSLVAACYVMCPDQLEASLERLYSLADELNSLTFGALTPGFYLNERLSHIVDNVIPDDLACIQNRLFVSLTRRKDNTNRIVSAYPDKTYLQKCLLASCFIPMYSMGYGAIPPEIDGDVYIDGGITENLPVFKDMNTVTISPFSGSALICPHDQNLFEWKMTLGNQLLKVNMSNVVRGAQALFPPSRATLHAYYEMGYRDGMKFLLNNGYLERAEGTPV